MLSMVLIMTERKALIMTGISIRTVLAVCVNTTDSTTNISAVIKTMRGFYTLVTASFATPFPTL